MLIKTAFCDNIGNICKLRDMASAYLNDIAKLRSAPIAHRFVNEGSSVFGLAAFGEVHIHVYCTIKLYSTCSYFHQVLTRLSKNWRGCTDD